MEGDGPGIHRKQYGFESNAHEVAGAATSTSSGKRRKGKVSAAGSGGVGGGKKPPIKMVFIGNPVRVTTSAEGFRALVQELTGRHAAEPYKHSGADIDAGADDADDSSGGSLVEAAQQAGALLVLPSPVSTPSSDAASSAAAGGAAQVSVPDYDDDDDDSFAPQLIDNSYYSVFSPPTFLYGPHGGEL